MRVLLPFLASLLILLALVQAQTDYTTSCNCQEQSVNGNYCHRWRCSNSADQASCFDGEGVVEVLAGPSGEEAVAATAAEVVSKRMKDLRLGDRVRTLDFESGETSFSPVIAWLHRDTRRPQSFLVLGWETEEGLRGELRVTAGHAVFVPDGETGSADWDSVALAGSLREGDHLMVWAAAKPGRARIVRISELLAEGIWAPLTESGSLVVSKSLVSAYANLPRQSLAHGSFAPLRWWHRATRALGLGLAAAGPLSLPQETDAEQGPLGQEVHPYASFLISLAGWFGVPLEDFPGVSDANPAPGAHVNPLLEWAVRSGFSS